LKYIIDSAKREELFDLVKTEFYSDYDINKKMVTEKLTNLSPFYNQLIVDSSLKDVSPLLLELFQDGVADLDVFDVGKKVIGNLFGLPSKGSNQFNSKWSETKEKLLLYFYLFQDDKKLVENWVQTMMNEIDYHPKNGQDLVMNDGILKSEIVTTLLPLSGIVPEVKEVLMKLNSLGEGRIKATLHKIKTSISEDTKPFSFEKEFLLKCLAGLLEKGLPSVSLYYPRLKLNNILYSKYCTKMICFGEGDDLVETNRFLGDGYQHHEDIEKISNLSDKWNITISGKPNRGLEVLGSELNLRLLYIHQVAPYFEGRTLTEATSSFLETLLQEYKIPKETKELLRKTISIMVERIHASRVLSCPIPYYRNDLTETPLVEKLIYHIEMTYKISLSQFEIDFLCFPFNVRFIDTLSKTSYQSEQLANIFQGIVKKVKETMLVHFDDEELFEEIKSHLGPLINRLIFHVQANDIFHGEVQTQYPFAFEMAKIAGEELSAIFGSELELSEIGYLALYFEMILRKQNSAVKGYRKQIAVVCTTGRGTAAMIIQQLRRVLGNDVDITQYSEEDFNLDLNQDYFAIFTTVPLKYKDSKSPVIQVNHLFDDQWLQEEWQRANAFHQKITIIKSRNSHIKTVF